eukprot:1162134-Pelagomonas_calceolata.AAC.3
MGSAARKIELHGGMVPVSHVYGLWHLPVPFVMCRPSWHAVDGDVLSCERVKACSGRWHPLLGDISSITMRRPGMNGAVSSCACVKACCG